MTQEFYTLVTDIGIAKFTNAQITQTAVNLSHVAVGDGDGKPYNPTQKQTALVNERWRGQVSSLAIDEENENYVNIEVTIPSSVGGWMIREIGVFDDEGDLILISKQPETFKPTFSMGSVKDMIIKLVMELSNTDVAEIKIDPTIITASRAYVDKNVREVDQKIAQVTSQLDQIDNKKAPLTEVQRLEKEKAAKTELAATNIELAKKANQDFVDAQFASIVSGSPKGTFTDYASLVAKYPQGAEGTMLVLADGHWYYWNDSVKDWLSGGVYQAQGIEDNSVSKEKIDFILETEENLYNPSYLVGAYISGNKTIGATYFESEISRTAVIPVKSGETYLLLRKRENNSDSRFRVASDTKIVANSSIVNKFLKDETNTPLVYDANYDYYLIDVPAQHQYLYVYLTINNNTLSANPLKMFETGRVDRTVAIDGVIESKNIVKTKNLFDGIYFNGAATGDLKNSSAQYFQSWDVGRCAIIKVKPLTSYSISKTTSNRFRVAVANKNPIGNLIDNRLYDGYTLLAGEEKDRDASITITTLADTEYLIVYVSSESKPPLFMQIEESEKVTEWERYGYKLYGELAKPNLSSDDDTELLKALFSVGGIVELDGNKKYRITSTIEINPEVTRRINGNGARIIPDGDFLAFKIKGKSTSHAGTSAAYKLIASEGGFVIDGLKIVPSEYYSCRGIEIDSTLQVSIINSALAFMKQAICIVNKNRNVIIANSHIYAMADDGIYLAPHGDIHQINIIGCHIHWCKYNIHSDNHSIYNIQITGNDIEADIYGVGSSFPYTPTSLIRFNQIDYVAEDVEIVGNTLEDHWAQTGDTLVFKGVVAVTVSGNVIGNNSNNDIYAENVDGLTIVGNTFKNSRKSALKLRGDIKNLVFNANANTSQSGGLIDADCGTIENLDISHNTVTQKSSNTLGIASCEIKAITLKNVTVVDNKLDVAVDGMAIDATNYNKVIIAQNIVSESSANKYDLPTAVTGNVVIRDNI